MKARKTMDRQEFLTVAEKKAREANSAMFEALCEVARKRNTAEFDRLFREYFEASNRKLTFDYTLNDQAAMHDRNTVIMQMAAEGNHKAVDWLISEFKVSPKKAVEGYARVGNVEKVEEFLRKGSYRDEAARGYAFAGNVDAVNNLIERDVNLMAPAYGYGRSGNLEEAKKLFDRNKEDKNNWKVAVFALEGFGHSLHYKCAQDFILHAAPAGVKEREVRKYFAPVLARHDDFSSYCDAVIVGFAGAGVFTHEDKLLELFATTSNEIVKAYYVMWLTSDRNVKRNTEGLLNCSIVDIAKQADEISQVMQKNTCDFGAARELMAQKAAQEAADKAAQEEAANKAAEEEAARKAAEEAAALEAVESEVIEHASEGAEEKGKQEAEVVAAEEGKKEEAAPEAKPELQKTKRQFFAGLFGKHKGEKVVAEKQAAEVAEKVAEDATKNAAASNSL